MDMGVIKKAVWLCMSIFFISSQFGGRGYT